MNPRQLLLLLLRRKPPLLSRSSPAPHPPVAAPGGGRLLHSSTPHSPADSARTRARASQILDRVPRSLRPYAARLRDAPISHVVSFLILHELTAVVPLVGLAGLFHWGGWLPPLFSDSSYLAPGIERFGRYFRRKGWFGLGEEEGEGEEVALVPPGGTVVKEGAGVEDGQGQAQVQKWNLDSPGMRIVVEVAAAYAVTKALLPLRLMLSVWATPWFARVIVGRAWGGLRGLGSAGRAAGRSAAGGSEAMRKAAKEVGKDVSKS